MYRIRLDLRPRILYSPALGSARAPSASIHLKPIQRDPSAPIRPRSGEALLPPAEFVPETPTLRPRRPLDREPDFEYWGWNRPKLHNGDDLYASRYRHRR